MRYARSLGFNADSRYSLGTMMVPVQLGLVPLYMLMGTLGLNGQLPAVMLPSTATASSLLGVMRSAQTRGPPEEPVSSPVPVSVTATTPGIDASRL